MANDDYKAFSGNALKQGKHGFGVLFIKRASRLIA